MGGLHHSPDLLIRSVDFATIEKLQAAGAWHRAGLVLNAKARALVTRRRGYAHCGNKHHAHKVADQVIEGISIPMLQIADARSSHCCKRTAVARLDGDRFHDGTRVLLSIGLKPKD